MSSNILYVNSLIVKRGEIFKLEISKFLIEGKSTIGLIGNNGAGKTTFFQSILNMLDFSSGEIKIFNMEWKKNDINIKKRLGVYLDETYIIHYMTIDEYFNFLRYVFKVPENQFTKRADEYISTLQLNYNPKQLIRDLSTGNQVKVGLIGSLLHNPEFVIWDEPFANLDPLTRKHLIELVLKLKDENTSFLISSHNIDELYEFSDDFLCLNNGSVIANGGKDIYTKKELLEKLGAT